MTRLQRWALTVVVILESTPRWGRQLRDIPIQWTTARTRTAGVEKRPSVPQSRQVGQEPMSTPDTSDLQAIRKIQAHVLQHGGF